jgi:hypothetical protein
MRVCVGYGVVWKKWGNVRTTTVCVCVCVGVREGWEKGGGIMRDQADGAEAEL